MQRFEAIWDEAAIATHRQARVWHDDESLWGHALALDANDAEALLHLGMSREGRATRHAIASERVRLLREALGFFERGEQCAKAPQYSIDIAVVCEKLALELPTESDAWLAQARAALARGFERAEQQHILEPEWLFERAVVAYRSGEIAGSVGDFRAFVALRPDDLAARRALALALLQLGRNAEALPEVEASVRLAPQDVALRLTLARLRDVLGRRNEARDAYTECLRLADGGAQLAPTDRAEIEARLRETR